MKILKIYNQIFPSNTHKLKDAVKPRTVNLYKAFLFKQKKKFDDGRYIRDVSKVFFNTMPDSYEALDMFLKEVDMCDTEVSRLTYFITPSLPAF